MLFDSETDPLRSWKADQNGTDGTYTTYQGIRYCAQSDIPTIIADTRAHEGSTIGGGIGADTSHVRILNSQFRTNGFPEEVERTVKINSGNDVQWRQWARGRLSYYIGQTLPYHDAFDRSMTYAAITLAYGCAPDMDPFRP